MDDVREVFTTEQAAEYLGVSRQWLEINRTKSDHPPFVRLGRMVRYRKASLDRWLLEKEQEGKPKVEEAV